MNKREREAREKLRKIEHRDVVQTKKGGAMLDYDGITQKDRGIHVIKESINAFRRGR